MYIEKLLQFISQKNPNCNLLRIKSAYNLAAVVHASQIRASGEPYIIHPIAVAKIIIGIGGDENMICAALLHDTIEDGENAEEIANRIYKSFGEDIYYLVQAVSKDGRIEDKVSQQDAYFVQIKEALETDVSVFFIKLADLTHNMDTISNLSPSKQKEWIKDLKEGYIPYFTEYFHKISFHYHPMYHKMMEHLQQIIEKKEAIS